MRITQCCAHVNCYRRARQVHTCAVCPTKVPACNFHAQALHRQLQEHIDSTHPVERAVSELTQKRLSSIEGCVSLGGDAVVDCERLYDGT